MTVLGEMKRVSRGMDKSEKPKPVVPCKNAAMNMMIDPRMRMLVSIVCLSHLFEHETSGIMIGEVFKSSIFCQRKWKTEKGKRRTENGGSITGLYGEFIELEFREFDNIWSL